MLLARKDVWGSNQYFSGPRSNGSLAYMLLEAPCVPVLISYCLMEAHFLILWSINFVEYFHVA